MPNGNSGGNCFRPSLLSEKAGLLGQNLCGLVLWLKLHVLFGRFGFGPKLSFDSPKMDD